MNGTSPPDLSDSLYVSGTFDCETLCIGAARKGHEGAPVVCYASEMTWLTSITSLYVLSYSVH